jgi:hypothetical protein
MPVGFKTDALSGLAIRGNWQLGPHRQFAGVNRSQEIAGTS